MHVNELHNSLKNMLVTWQRTYSNQRSFVYCEDLFNTQEIVSAPIFVILRESNAF